MRVTLRRGRGVHRSRADRAAYHLRVRRLFIILMIALLPLRGWAGEFMSAQMAAGTAASQAVDAMPADCPMHAQADASKASHSSSGMEGCMSCGLCIPMTEATFARFDGTAFAAHSLPSMPGAKFVSAGRALPLKPPIS